MSYDFNMFDAAGNIDVASVFANGWFFGIADFGFIFVLFATALLLNRYGYGFGQIVGIVFALSLAFATLTSSVVMWGIVLVIVIFSGLRFLQNVLLKIQ